MNRASHKPAATGPADQDFTFARVAEFISAARSEVDDNAAFTLDGVADMGDDRAGAAVIVKRETAFRSAGRGIYISHLVVCHIVNLILLCILGRFVVGRRRSFA